MSLSWRVKAGYGAAEMGINGVEVLIRVGLLIFYTDVVGLAPALAGYAVAIGVLWDAFTDPLMGRISDRTHGRFGRRRPWILLGALLLGLAIVVLFSPPEVESQSAKFAVLLGSYIFANTAMTIIAVPHAALAGDLSDDTRERATLFGWRLLFANAGLVIGTALPGMLVAQADDPASLGARAGADVTTAAILAVLTLATATVTLVTTREHDRDAVHPDEAQVPYLGALKAVLANRCFLPLFAAWLVANIGLNVNSTTALYYYRYRLALEESETRIIIAVFMLVFCLSIPAWILVARRFGKKQPLIAGVAALGTMNCIVYVLFPEGNPWWPLLASLIGGLAIGSVVLLDAMLADVVDYDRMRSRESRFGLYFGFWKMGGKASRAVAIALAGNVLSWIGFEPNTEQSAATAFDLALLFGPGVGVFFLAAAAIVCFHPLDEERHERVARVLARRDARAEAGGD